MVTEIDLRERPDHEHRTRIDDALAEAEVGDELLIIADQDVDTHLISYQIEHGRSLEWGHEHPDAEPRELRVVKREPLSEGALGTFDVRDLIPQRRHEVLLDTFERLEPGDGFVLVNDHDPKPLYYELRSMHGDVIGWEYASNESDNWRVEITKTDESNAVDEDIVTRYDVRQIPKSDRHPTIHHRYGMIPEGGTMELIAPHEPRPLRQEFRQQYGDSFTWEVVESDPGRCRVQVTKGDSSEGVDEPSGSDDDVATSAADDEAIEISEELDVRDLPPAQRHERIFDAYDELDAGNGFILVNDHDPKPLYHQFEAEAGPEFHWAYRQRDPGEFRVLIGKVEALVDDASAEETEPPF